MHADDVRAVLQRAAGVRDLDPARLVAVLVAALPEGLGAAVRERARHALPRRHRDVAPARHVGAVPNVVLLPTADSIAYFVF